jgi:hypothetical protein
MDYYARVKEANKQILNKKFTTTVTFTSPYGETQVVKCFYIDVGMDVNMNTGMPMRARKVALSAHIEDFTIGNPADTVGTWRALLTNNVGEEREGIVDDPVADKTLGMITMVVKNLKKLGS